MKDLCQKWKIKLIFKAPIDCQEPRWDYWVFGNHWRRV